MRQTDFLAQIEVALVRRAARFRRAWVGSGEQDEACPISNGRFPPSNLDWLGLMPLIGSAHAALARHGRLVSATPSANALIAPLVLREAVRSSTLEGTGATMREALATEAAASADQDPGASPA